MRRRGAPVGSGRWLQIDISQASEELRATARSSRGEEPPAHTLGACSAPGLIRQFGEWVKDSASRGVPLAPLARAQELYQALIQQGLQQTLHQLQGSAEGESVLLRLHLTERELHGLPWEALCRPGTTVDFLGTSQEVALVRSASSLKPWEPCRVEDAVRLLVISPADEDAPERLKAVLHPSLEANELKWLTPLTGSHASAAYLFNRLRLSPVPHILHFIGHGGFDSEGHPTLQLADRHGDNPWIKVELLAKELEPHTRDTLRLVVLEACEGARPGALASAAALLVQAGVGTVVAHLWPVRADVARRCSAIFYRSLAGTATHRGNVARSLHDARRTLLAEFQESAEAFSPVLYLRGHEPILFELQGRKPRPPSPQAPTAHSHEAESAAQALREMLQKPCSLLLGDHGVRPLEDLRQAMHEELQGTSRKASIELPLSALAQRYALEFGDESLSTLFQTMSQGAPHSPLMVEALARWMGPGVHITLLRVPVLEELLARHHPSRRLYVLLPSRSDSRTVLTLQHAPGQGWVKLRRPPEAFDLQQETVVLRLYRGYLPQGVFGDPLLTEDDHLLHVRKLEEMLPPELATVLKSGLSQQPSLVLGLSLLSWDHRHLLYSLFGHRPLKEGSAVLLEPGSTELEAWRSGQGLPGGLRGGGLRPIQAPFPALAEHLGALAPGGLR